MANFGPARGGGGYGSTSRVHWHPGRGSDSKVGNFARDRSERSPAVGATTVSRASSSTGSNSLLVGTAPRTAIKDLAPHLPNTVIVGVVLTKQAVCSFPDKKNPGSERYKLSFTLRDSPVDYINVTCWGGELFITNIHHSFKIYDVVELRNCQISSKSGLETEEKWRPWTSSPFQINLSEMHSSLSVYSGRDYTNFSSLVHVPLRPPNDYYTLSDVLTNGQSLDGSYINLLLAIRCVNEPKEMTSKTGKQLKKCEVKVMDEGCSSFDLMLWDRELIDLAQTWTPKTILFIVDVKLTFDRYRNAMVGTCNQRSLITTNPDCPEAHKLYQYVQGVDVETLSTHEDNGGSDDLQSITDVYTVHQLNKLAPDMKEQGVFSTRGIVYACLTTLDIDGNTRFVVSYRCSVCKFKVLQEAIECSNRRCSTVLEGGAESFSVEPMYDVRVSLSDYTGSVDGVRLYGQQAVELLGVMPLEFLSMSDSRRTEIKSSLLLERFKIYFKVFSAGGSDQSSGSVRVLSISLADPGEAAVYLHI